MLYTRVGVRMDKKFHSLLYMNRYSSYVITQSILLLRTLFELNKHAEDLAHPPFLGDCWPQPCAHD
jgi:hypothetical protein